MRQFDGNSRKTIDRTFNHLSIGNTFRHITEYTSSRGQRFHPEIYIFNICKYIIILIMLSSIGINKYVKGQSSIHKEPV